MSRPPDWADADHILCVRLDTLGDVLMTTPALRALKESRPGRRLTFLTSAPGAEAARLVPEIDHILVYDAPWMKATAPRADSRPDLEMVERLRAGGYGAAVIFTVYSQNPLPAAMLCFLADIPLRLAHCHENPYQLLTNWLPDPEPAAFVRHEVRRQLDLVAAIGGRTTNERLSIRFSQAARVRVGSLLQEMRIGADEPWMVFHCGASAASRRYPPEQFAEAARLLAVEPGYPIVFTGAANENPLIEEIRSRMAGPSHSLVGRLSLAELAALLASASLLVSNNTGPVHVAAALGTPVVDLYALTNPQHAPWAVPSRVLFHDVPCKYCYKSVCPEGHQDCLRLVSPKSVAAAARELLRETLPTQPATHANCAPLHQLFPGPWKHKPDSLTRSPASVQSDSSQAAMAPEADAVKPVASTSQPKSRVLSVQRRDHVHPRD
jgi:lipopolysaccharide heptosyltransferase II